MLCAPSLSELPGIRHAFFTREGGVSGGIYTSLNAGVGSRDDQDHVRENRARMAAMVGAAADRFLTAYQVHSPTALVVDRPWPGERPKADALVTNTPGLSVGASTADCGPVLFADPQARVIGAAHAGWRGAFTGVLEATLEAMESLGGQRDRIRAALGPMIRQRNYEVGAEFVDNFLRQSEANKQFFTNGEREGHAQFDLPGYIAARLRACGLQHIEDLGLCTYADPDRFYSYRRSVHLGEGDYGRHVNAICLID